MGNGNSVRRAGLSSIAFLLAWPCLAADLTNVPGSTADAISTRAMNEAKALLLDRNLDPLDVRLLTDRELDSSPVNLNATDTAFPRQPSSGLDGKIPSVGPEFRYQYRVRLGDFPERSTFRDLATDARLRPPAVSLDLSDPLYPTVRVPTVKGPDGNDALYYFEVDTSPSFDSPNFWRYPSLQALVGPEAGIPDNLSGRSGLAFDLFNATQRDTDGRSNELRFPFRATAMRLPNRWGDLTYEELERQALALGYGLGTNEKIAEIHKYVRHSYAWGNDTLTRSALDVFRSGVAECGAFNNLLGTMLELNGIRYRVVSGFDPKYRVINPMGAHSVIEVYDRENKVWFVVDSYFDLLLWGVSVEKLAAGKEPQSKLPLFQLRRPHHQAMFGQTVTIGQLFKYRMYGDALGRLPTASMLSLQAGSGEHAYGSQWKLNVGAPRPKEELFSESKKIYVRARYVLAGIRTVSPLGAAFTPLLPSERAVASPWGVTSFEIAPRELMAAYQDITPPESQNLCELHADKGVSLGGQFEKELGHAFRLTISGVGPADNSASPRRSELVLCEDGKPLGPAHSYHDDIRGKGNGRYSHWIEWLYFSTSDNSDPNANGRRYTIIDLASVPR